MPITKKPKQEPHSQHVKAWRASQNGWHPRDAHVQACHDYRANGRDAFFRRIRNFKGDIVRSPAAGDYDLTANEIKRIDFALNEYMAAQNERHDDHTTRLRQDRQTAADTITAAIKGLETALSALDAIAKNPYAKSAIYAAAQGEFSRRRHRSKRQDTDGLTKAVQSLKRLHAVTKRAQAEPSSDGLPNFPEGVPDDPGFELLLFRIRNTMRDRTDKTKSPNKAEDREPLRTNSSIAEFIKVILDIAGVKTRNGKGYSVKSIINRLSEIDEAFPTIG